MMKLFDEETIQLTDPEAAAGLVVEVVPLVMRTIRREMRAHSGRGLTVPHVQTLAFVGRNPGAPLSGLAEHLGIGRPSASKLVDILTARGLLTRTPSPADRRYVALELTAEGVNVLQAARYATRARLAERLQSLSPDGLTAVARAMVALRDAFHEKTNP